MSENLLTNPSIHRSPKQTFYSNSIQPPSHNNTLLFLPHHFIFNIPKSPATLPPPSLSCVHNTAPLHSFFPPLAASLTLTVRTLTVVHLNLIWITVNFYFFSFLVYTFVTLLVPCFNHSVSELNIFHFLLNSIPLIISFQIKLLVFIHISLIALVIHLVGLN